jgi:hypothetical protein
MTKHYVLTLAATVAVMISGCSKPGDATGKANSDANGPNYGKLSVTTASAPGNDKLFKVTLTRATAAPAPNLIGLLVNTAVNGAAACYVFQQFDPKRLMLVNDSGSGSKSVSASSGSVSNAQCVLRASSSAAVSADTITVTFRIHFKPSFAGTKALYVTAQDADGIGTPLTPAGEVKII